MKPIVHGVGHPGLILGHLHALRRFLLRTLWIGVLSLPASLPASDLKLASFFRAHMVLQRERPIHIWGEGEPNAPVKVHFASREAASTIDSDGHWQVVLKPLSYGGPYSLTVS